MNQSLRTESATTVATQSVAESYLSLLHDRGIEYLYVGAGTDTAPVIEAYARAESAGLAFPKPVVAVHENLAVGMAHGYYMVTQRPQAVMLHVSVGAANAVCGLLNATRAQVPILFTAGRTPLYEQGPVGSRTHEVHWAQEMYDQGGMVRELVKWDYELRDGHQVEQVVDRAMSLAMAEPRGPVYLTLPREVLAQPTTSCRLGGQYVQPSPAHPDSHAVAQLARAMAQATVAAIVCTHAGSDPHTVALLNELSKRHGIGVLENRPRYVSADDTSPLHLGYDLPSVLPHADALLFLDTDVPWIPAATSPRDNAFVAHAASDPLFSRYPIRSFRGDLTITANPAALLRALLTELDRLNMDCSARGTAVAALATRRRLAVEDAAQRDADVAGPITKLFFTRCLDAVRPDDSIVVNEYPLMREHMHFQQAGTFFQLPSAGGLGWGMPAALGALQAQPKRTVIAALGDGAYLFANPAACHQAAEMLELPLLTVIYNNECWDGVQKAATGMYPNAHSQQALQRQGAAPLSSLKPLPAFEKYVEASGGYGERVTERAQLRPALERALHAVRTERRQALLNVIGA